MKTKIITLFGAAIFFSSSLLALKAPDFTVTDYNGKVHRLYADYLDKKTVVVLKFFFVQCPPCNAIAPTVQEAYVRWGSGNNRVQFIELSTLTTDNNSFVRSYAQTHNITFPGVGNDGGGEAATRPYKTSQFGQWYGTPSFAVISPDGEVKFNVAFSKTNQAAFDTAVARALRVGVPGGGGGCTRAFNIEVVSKLKADQYLLQDLELGQQGYVVPDGKYNCEFTLPSNIDGYYIFCEKNTPVDHLLNVTTADILQVQRYLLDIIKFNNLQKAVADVNNSGGVTITDMSEIRKLILGFIPSFSKIPSQYVSLNDPTATSGPITNKVKLVDVLAVVRSNKFGIGKYGDVTNVTNVQGNVFEERSNEVINFDVKSEQLLTGEWVHHVTLPYDFSSLAFQFQLNARNADLVLLSTHPNFSNSVQTNTSLLDRNFICLWSSAKAATVTIPANENWFVFKTKKELSLQVHSGFPAEFVLDDHTIVSNVKFKVTSSVLRSFIYPGSYPDQFVVASNNAISNIRVYSPNGNFVPCKVNGLYTEKVELEIPSVSGLQIVEISHLNGVKEFKKLIKI